MKLTVDQLLKSIAEQRVCMHITRGEQPAFAAVSVASSDQQLCITQKLCAFCLGQLVMQLHCMRAPLSEQVK